MPIGPGRPLALEKPCQIDIDQAARVLVKKSGHKKYLFFDLFFKSGHESYFLRGCFFKKRHWQYFLPNFVFESRHSVPMP